MFYDSNQPVIVQNFYSKTTKDKNTAAPSLVLGKTLARSIIVFVLFYSMLPRQQSFKRILEEKLYLFPFGLSNPYRRRHGNIMRVSRASLLKFFTSAARAEGLSERKEAPVCEFEL